MTAHAAPPLRLRTPLMRAARDARTARRPSTATRSRPSGRRTRPPGSAGRGPEGISFPGLLSPRRIDDVVARDPRDRARSSRCISTCRTPTTSASCASGSRVGRRAAAARALPPHSPPTSAGRATTGRRSCSACAAARTETAVVDWGFNAWGGKYPPWDADDAVPTRVAAELGLPVFHADIVMEGGAVDFNGAGTVLTTTSCLLNKNRNPGLSKREIEQLPEGLLRPAARGLARRGHRRRRHRRPHRRPGALHRRADDRDGVEDDPARRQLQACCATTGAALDRARDATAGRSTIVELPMPRPVVYRGPAAAGDLRELLVRQRRAAGADVRRPHARPRRALARPAAAAATAASVVGVDCRALIWGLGAIHCLTQQQPAG